MDEPKFKLRRGEGEDPEKDFLVTNKSDYVVLSSDNVFVVARRGRVIANAYRDIPATIESAARIVQDEVPDFGMPKRECYDILGRLDEFVQAA
tara:strand:+ start:2742 stop:3020 length:279 start_codon:yes stop_codon:yes gene_type:complete